MGKTFFLIKEQRTHKFIQCTNNKAYFKTKLTNKRKGCVEMKTMRNEIR